MTPISSFLYNKLISPKHTSYSNFGDDDISDLIRMFTREFFVSTRWKILMRSLSFVATQSSSGSGDDKPPDSTMSSETSLGKRKASSDMSSSSTIGSGPFRPPKISRPIPQCEEDKSPDNPFIDHGPPEPEVPENPFAPIIIVRLFVQHAEDFDSDARASNLVASAEPTKSIHGEKASLWSSI